MARLSPEESQVHDKLSEADKQLATRAVSRALYTKRQGDLVINPQSRLGAPDSAHDVFFATNTQAGDSLAIKRFRRSESAVAELENMQTARERGFTTFEPVGEAIYEVPKIGSLLVTHRMPNFRTLNYAGWDAAMPGTPGYKILADTLQGAAGHIGEVHAKGIIHNDFQVKNVGSVPAGFVLHDLEGAYISNDPAHDPDLTARQADELNKFTGSLIKHGYLASATKGMYEQEMAAQVLEPYLDANPNDEMLEAWESVMAHAGAKREREPYAGSSAQVLGGLALYSY